MSGLGYAIGLDVLVVGVETDPTEVDETGAPLTRCYIDSRGSWRYVLVGGDDAANLRREWGGMAHHLTIPRPPADRTYVDVEARDEMRRQNEARWLARIDGSVRDV